MEVLNMGFEPYAVIVNGICKQLCLKVFPEMSTVTRAIEICNIVEPVESRTNEPIEWACLKRDHKVYAFLAQGIASFPRKECLSEALGASSTDNYPDESIRIPRNQVTELVRDLLTGRARKNLICIISVLSVWFPHISSKGCKTFDGGFVLLENCLQKFKLPEPVLCIGGILQVQLLGRVQKQEIDSLYYICERDFSRIHRFGASIRGWEHMILNTLPGARGIMVNDYDYDGEDDDSDDQYN
ncbi:F-box protein At4g00755-like [Coffea eugenioides]|uniref:F-box protein At4g00755-like n=1 Tax=Coffea eugenioides TaxID=49369 RepID=UPI000F613751|nr:F-box protein At4g00755-like [Coffea eugenioides]